MKSCKILSTEAQHRKKESAMFLNDIPCLLLHILMEFYFSCEFIEREGDVEN